MNDAQCPTCHAVLNVNMLELSFICPICGKRVPPAAMWGLSNVLDERIVRTDASFQAFMRGYHETDTLEDYSEE